MKCFSYHLNELEIIERLSSRRLVVLKKVDSTNQYIMDHISYLKSGDVFVTENQTLGRGRHNKIWYTVFGQNICLSIYWRLNRVSSTLIEISIMVGIVLATILKKLGVSQVKIKWPNDLYVYEKKLAGILVEVKTRVNCVSHIVIGIGINLSMQNHASTIAKISNNWINLQDVIDISSFNRNMLVVLLVNFLREKLEEFEKYGLLPFWPFWKNFDFLYKRKIALFSKNYSIKYGIACGINIHGALRIVDEIGHIYYYSGDNFSVIF